MPSFIHTLAGVYGSKTNIADALLGTASTRMAKYGLWLCLALFSLSPCTVKEALFDWVDIAYAKPPNKSKTVAPASVCAYLPSGEPQASTTKQSESNPVLEPAVFAHPQFSDVPATPIHSRYAKTSSGNSPPKYILYKRLKIGVA